MPIRMTDDDEGSSNDNDDSGGGAGGGSGSGGGGRSGGTLDSLLALFSVITFLFRHPKLTLVLLVLGVGYYFFAGHRSSSSAPAASSASPGNGPSPSTANAAAPTFGGNRGPGTLGTGATLDPKVYDTALVHEPLADTGNPALPERVSLLEYAPERRSQGHQGSCVGWATSYAARSILWTQQTGEAAAFSPSFAYNQISRPGCNGTYLTKALDLLKYTGDLPLKDFKYDPDTCSAKPSRDQKAAASEFRIRGYDRLSVDADDYRTNAAALKQHLAQSAPVVIGMDVGGTFETAMRGTRVWHPTRDDYDRKGDWGGHAMAVIGYDDTLEGGAFQVMNSWGADWGQDGVGYVRYKDFAHFVKEAYGLYPMGNAHAKGAKQKIHFGLIDNATKRRIPLAAQSGTTWRTSAPIKKGTRFKVEFSNTQPVYTYIFGQETDGSSYVLFPYSEKHNPYCGTIGTRVFPRKQSLTADAVGTRDSIAVVIAPEPLDFKALNQQITAQAGAGYPEKLKGALGSRVGAGAKVEAKDDALELTEGETGKLYALVIEFDKQ